MMVEAIAAVETITEERKEVVSSKILQTLTQIQTPEEETLIKEAAAEEDREEVKRNIFT